MKTNFITIIALAISILSINAQKVNQKALISDFEAVLKNMDFSGSVIVAKDGKHIFEKTYGLSSKEKKTPNTIETKYNYASMGKMFTGMAIMQLVEKGKLKLSDKLIDIIPDYPNKDAASRITVEHLLTHTSGITSLPRMSASKYLVELKDYLPQFVNEPLAFTPGERMSYSNAGYVVLGLIIEEVTGISYFDYIQKNIFDPAKMENTGFKLNDKNLKNMASHYSNWMNQGNGEPELVEYDHDGNSGGGGYSTVIDWIKFSNCLKNYELLSKKNTEEMIKGRVDGRSRGMYGYGFYANNIFGIQTTGHGGGGGGANGELQIYWNEGYAIAILSNRDPHGATFIKDAFTGLLLKHMGLLPEPTMGGKTTFQLKGHENAHVVTVHGAFTNGNMFKYPLKKEKGKWVTKIDLPTGKHYYRFIVDGVSYHDPDNPNKRRVPGGIFQSEIEIK
ncbi:serine hydrolase [Leptobacterium sp. I13]|uniref:serine hydrolase n=1 Tax=Leptobacterium meishanense TaxID=3128904 RepID=UPI0030EFA42B